MSFVTSFDAPWDGTLFGPIVPVAQDGTPLDRLLGAHWPRSALAAADMNDSASRPNTYVIVDMDVTDPDRYAADYVPLSGPSVEAAGGRYLARGGETAVLEGAAGPTAL